MDLAARHNPLRHCLLPRRRGDVRHHHCISGRHYGWPLSPVGDHIVPGRRSGRCRTGCDPIGSVVPTQRRHQRCETYLRNTMGFGGTRSHRRQVFVLKSRGTDPCHRRPTRHVLNLRQGHICKRRRYDGGHVVQCQSLRFPWPTRSVGHSHWRRRWLQRLRRHIHGDGCQELRGICSDQLHSRPGFSLRPHPLPPRHLRVAVQGNRGRVDQQRAILHGSLYRYSPRHV
mmetsp:Transcript_53367/g.125514  ORF Transcript_53367/g.125514 Transcript_53367/m.125514 type:complete len:228 (+) Transcript_53367:694-1377(+)